MVRRGELWLWGFLLALDWKTVRHLAQDGKGFRVRRYSQCLRPGIAEHASEVPDVQRHVLQGDRQETALGRPSGWVASVVGWSQALRER